MDQRTGWWLLALSVWATSTGSAAEPREDHCVVLISVDGLANYYFDDPKAQMPTIRQLAAEGVRAEGMLCSFPTVTWPNHTTLVTGTTPAQHGVMGNNYLDRRSGMKIGLIVDPLFDKDEIVKVPTIYDAAHKAGLETAGIVWPATRNARTLDWTVPDMAGDAWLEYGTKHWLEELREAHIPVDSHGKWTKDPEGGGVRRDWLYTRLAQHLFEHHPPNLMLIHLIEVDHVEHKFGPRSPEAYWAISNADDRVRDIVEAARKSRFGDKVTFVVVSDHGFLPITRDIRPNVFLRELELISEVEGSKEKRAFCVAQGGACMVYVLDDGARQPIVELLKERLPFLEGVEAVMTAEEAGALGQGLPGDDSRLPDLWICSRSGYAFTDVDTGEDIVADREAPGGTHGFLPDQEDLYGTLIFSGAGVGKGKVLPRATNIDVAPTMARLLGVELPTANGEAINGVFAD